MSDNDDFMMSDDEDNFEYEDSDEEMEDFQYDSDNEDNTENNNETSNSEKLDFEKMYYSAKSMKEDNEIEALNMFSKLINYEIPSDVDLDDSDISEIANFRFKSIKQKLKILFNLSKLDEFLQDYQKLFTFSDKLNDSIYFTTSLEKIIDRLTKNNEDTNFVLCFVNKSLEYSRLMNDKLFMKLYIIKIRILAERDDLDSKEILQDMIKCAVLKAENFKDYSKNQFLLEIYTIQLKGTMATLPKMDNIKNYKNQLETNYTKCVGIMSNIILHPKMLGVIKEAGGKIDMLKKDFVSAIDKIAESFKNYDEAGSVEDKLRMLKILIVLNILALKSEISILQSNNIKPYLTNQAHNNDKEIIWLITLLRYYEINNIFAFKDLLQKFQVDSIENDILFLALFISDMHKSINFRLLLQTFKVFSQIRFDYITNLLGLENINEVQDLIFEMISLEILTERICFNFVDKTLKVSRSSKTMESFSVIPKSLDPKDVVINMNNLNKNMLLSKNSKVNKDSISEEFIYYLKLGLFEKSKDSFTQNEVVQLETSWRFNKLMTNTSTISTQVSRKILSNTSINHKLSGVIVDNMKTYVQMQKFKYKESKDKTNTNRKREFENASFAVIFDKLNDLQGTLFSTRELTYIPTVSKNDRSR